MIVVVVSVMLTVVMMAVLLAQMQMVGLGCQWLKSELLGAALVK